MIQTAHVPDALGHAHTGTHYKCGGAVPLFQILQLGIQARERPKTACEASGRVDERQHIEKHRRCRRLLGCGPFEDRLTILVDAQRRIRREVAIHLVGRGFQFLAELWTNSLAVRGSPTLAQ